MAASSAEVEKLEYDIKKARVLVDRLRVGMSEQDRELKKMRVRLEKKKALLAGTPGNLSAVPPSNPQPVNL
eukprot:gene23513-28467_t